MKSAILILAFLINFTDLLGQKNYAIKSKTKQSVLSTKRNEVKNKRNVNATFGNGDSENSTSESIFCTSESGYDYVNYYKLTLYENISAMMEKDGNKRFGNWGFHDGNIYAKFNNAYIFLEKEIDSNMIFDKQNRQWYKCLK